VISDTICALETLHEFVGGLSVVTYELFSINRIMGFGAFVIKMLKRIANSTFYLEIRIVFVEVDLVTNHMVCLFFGSKIFNHF